MTAITSTPQTTGVSREDGISSREGARRRRWSREQKAELLARFEASGLSAAQFCRENAVHVATFSQWRRQLGAPPGGESRPIGSFARVRVIEPAGNQCVSVELGGGVSLSVPVGADALWLGRVLRSVREH